MKSIYTWLVLGVVIVSFFLRIWQIEQNPNILNRDEAALAYNGLLLSKTGQDEWGRSWPLALESFGDYKLPGYPFLLAIIFKVLPPADWVVRLPSVIAGSFLPALIYVLARKLKLSQILSLVAAMIIATSPVFFFYSRMAFEANLTLVVVITALILLMNIKFIWWRDLLAVSLLAVGSFTYNTPLLLMPFFALLISIMRGARNYRYWVVTSAALLIVFLAIWMILTPLTSQKSAITIFAHETIVTAYPIYRAQFNGIWSSLLGNQYLYYGRLIVMNLLASFGGNFLVVNGGAHPWHSIPGWGNINWLIYVLLLASVFWIIYRVSSHLINLVRAHKSFFKSLARPWINSSLGRMLIVLYVVIIALAPATITADAPHTTRSLLFLALIPILISLTFADILPSMAGIKKTSVRQLELSIFVGLTLVSLICFSRYLFAYFTRYPSIQTIIFQSGFDEFIKQVDDQSQDQAVAIVDPSGYQYILLSWYLKISPEEFFSSVIRQAPDRIGFRYGEQVAQYHFISQRADRNEEQLLVEWTGDAWQLSRF